MYAGSHKYQCDLLWQKEAEDPHREKGEKGKKIIICLVFV
jgi:hypothetical protein